VALKFWNFGFEMLFQRSFMKKYKIHILGGRQKPYYIDSLGPGRGPRPKVTLKTKIVENFLKWFHKKCFFWGHFWNIQIPIPNFSVSRFKNFGEYWFTRIRWEYLDILQELGKDRENQTNSFLTLHGVSKPLQWITWFAKAFAVNLITITMYSILLTVSHF
jgi:hypothetical protein